MAQPIEIYFLGIAPIPVGHRIEVRTYYVETGVFTKKREPDFNRPLITDLDTGVVYSDANNFENIIAYRSGDRRKFPTRPRADLQPHGLWRATVRECIVMSIGYGQSAYTQTTLVVDPIVAEK
jgi:hypothetical protein